MGSGPAICDAEVVQVEPPISGPTTGFIHGMRQPQAPVSPLDYVPTFIPEPIVAWGSLTRSNVRVKDRLGACHPGVCLLVGDVHWLHAFSDLDSVQLAQA